MGENIYMIYTHQMTRFIAMKTNSFLWGFCLGLRFSLDFRLIRNLYLGFTLLLESLSFVNHKYMAGLFLHTLLSNFKHCIQLNKGFLHVIHIIVHDKLVITIK